MLRAREKRGGTRRLVVSPPEKKKPFNLVRDSPGALERVHLPRIRIYQLVGEMPKLMSRRRS